MITLDDFIETGKIQKHKEGKTRKEYSINDLPYEIRKNVSGWLKEVEKKNLNVYQKDMLDLIKNGASIKIQKGKKKENIQIVEPYSPYLILQLYKSLKVRK
ncbi:MAG: hypothetical protein RXO36_05830 [Candidatus Nanopusillus acidilobi]